MGRRFCECRSRDFIPRSERKIIVIAYSIHDEFIAHSFEAEAPDLDESIIQWLKAKTAIAYILLQRESKNLQEEFPSPLGREPMDRLTISAATEDVFRVSTFYLQENARQTRCNLIETTEHPYSRSCGTRNLLRQRPVIKRAASNLELIEV